MVVQTGFRWEQAMRETPIPIPVKPKETMLI